MAKTAFGIDALSKPFRTQVTNLKRSVMDAATKFNAVREKLADLAPRVVKLFTSLQAEHETMTFVDFCRLFDPTVPTHAADRGAERGYRNHPTYYTLNYMRRVVQLNGANRQRGGQQGVRDSAADGLARSLATILQVVDTSSVEKVWKALQDELGFSERIMTRLRKRVEQTEPLFKMQLAKPAKVGNVIHMERTAAQPDTDRQTGANEPLAQPGRRIRKQAA
jgi:hypothetical protein